MEQAVYDKVRTQHRQRKAYLYVRQSTLRQVAENTESTQRQYGLKERAAALGWDAQQIVVIDNDLGQSGASSADREGFQRLVTEVSMGRVGIVLGLEVSRLARNSSDWHRLLELCAYSDTLILDEDGIYDPQQFNDRLVLGLKGTLSEAELHVLRSRMRGGILNKARRGELAIPLPVGFVYAANGKVVVDPDQQVQASVRQLFAGFRRTGSAAATMREFKQNRWTFPVRSGAGARPGELKWEALTRNRVNAVLRNPRYAGAYAYGQYRGRRKPDGSGRHVERVARQDWYTLQHNAHEGYLSWEEYEQNLELLRANAPWPQAQSERAGATREGPALLQGLAYCGRCGARMNVRYHRRGNQLVPDYVCDRGVGQRGEPPCQCLSGRRLDQAMAKVLLESIRPDQLELAVAVEEEIQRRQVECDRLRQMQLERARYEASLAERRYKRVDPDNRLVAGTLETNWNEKLRAVRKAEQECERFGETRAGVNAEVREQIRRLSEDFPRLWHDPTTPDRERKRMARLILEDVTLTREQRRINAQIRFKGGATQTIEVSTARTDPETIAMVDRLLRDHHRPGRIAAVLNEAGLCTARGTPYTEGTVRGLIARHLPERQNARALPAPPSESAAPDFQDGQVTAYRGAV